MNKKIFDFGVIRRKLRYRTAEFDLESYSPWLDKINELPFGSLEDAQLKRRSLELIRRARSGTPLNELLVEAYGLVREAASRVLGMRPFDVQVIAGMAMHDRNLVEMQTGEGKTLAAVLPAYLNALSGLGVHVLTFNDYLAQRDAEWMGPVYRFLGLTAGHVGEGMDMDRRKEAYGCDVTYLTAKEAGFDYLRSFLCLTGEEIVQRPFHFAIIDEADSLLIDEARIPLVIAGKNEDCLLEPGFAAELVKRLKTGVHYEADMEKEGLKSPSSTWTYLINDSPEQLGINPLAFNPLAAAVNLPLWFLTAIYYRFFRKERE